MNDPLVITGHGVISAAGASPEEVFAAALRPAPDPGGKDFPAVPFDLSAPDRRVAAKLDRTCELALFAARAAADEALLTHFDPGRVGVAVGTSRGPVGSWIDAFERLAGKRPMRPTLAAAGSLASLSGAVAAAHGFGGPSTTVSATCASAAHAVVTAAQWVEAGMADAVLAGGAEAPLHEFLLSQMHAAGLVAPPGTGIRPFDRNRAGFIPGEGAAFLVLEKLSSARARDAHVVGELAGWSLKSAPSGKTGVEADGATLAAIIRETVEMAGLRPRDIDYVNAHGTGTPANDGVEALTLARVLPGVSASSTKAVTGHCLGATPAMEAVLCLQSLAKGELPPNHGCREPVAECDGFELLLQPGAKPGIRNTISLSSGFWGNHAALCFSRCRPD